MSLGWIHTQQALPVPRELPVHATLKAARAAWQAGAAGEALRYLDRALRTAADESGAIAAAYAEVLLHEGSNPPAALTLLQRAAAADPTARIEALTIETLRRCGRAPEAEARLRQALQNFCVVPQADLARAATAVLAILPTEAGWVALDPELKLHGELARSAEVRVHDAGGRLLARQRPAAGDGPRRFSILLPRDRQPEPLTIIADNVNLLGSGLSWPPDFGLDGRAEGDDRTLRGWARLGWHPEAPLKLRVTDEAGHVAQIDTQPAARSRQEFAEQLRGSGLRGTRFVVSARLPNGDFEPLPDAPLLLPAALRLPAEQPSRARRRKTKPRDVDILIPVYRGHDETLQCIESVLGARGGWRELIVIDDASPEPPLRRALDRLARKGRIRLLRNDQNLGFAATVNRGLALNPARDCVVLNADTVVHGDWLRRLRAAAYRAPDTGTVTPLSNDGSVASYLRHAAHELDVPRAAELDRLAARSNRGRDCELPAGVGFCLYLRRDCLDDVGLLDAEVFGKGYGEETDLCLRALRRGWKHKLAADTFVLHSGGRSFGGRRVALQARAQRLLHLRHPQFARQLSEFERADPGRILRRNLAEAQLQSLKARLVLLVTLALGGGVARYVEERRTALREQGLGTLELRPGPDGHDGCLLRSDHPGVGTLRYRLPDELPALQKFLRGLRLQHTELHHFLGLPPRLIEMLRGLSVPYDIFVHDYVWFCPRITLMDHSRRYCGEPAVRVCESCVKRIGSNLGEDISVAALRRRSAVWLSSARRVLAPSDDAAQRMMRRFPSLQVLAQPLQAQPAIRRRPVPTHERIRVALIGAIGNHKGYLLLWSCVRDAIRRKLPLEFSVIGYTLGDSRLLKTGRVFITGRYVDAEVPALLLREQAQAVLLPSVWPETWSYTLTHALASGLPVVAFDIGAIAERLRKLNTGHLLPLDTTPAELNDYLLTLATAPETESLAAAYKRLVAQSLNAAPTRT